jgi:hypothetical protein
MKSYLTTLLASTLYINLALGQVAPSKLNALSIEVGKTGFIYSLNYDHVFEKMNFGFRLGAGSNFSKYLNGVMLGGGAYSLFGKTKHFFELGLDLHYLEVDETSDDQKGVTLIYPDYSVKTAYLSLNLGYRWYAKNTLFRVGFSPGYLDNKFVPGGYTSFGYRF